MDPQLSTDPFARQANARRYANLKRGLFFVDLAMVLAGAGILLTTGLSVWLRSQVERLTINPWLVVLGYAISLGGVYLLVTFPLNVYRGFVLPRRFGLSHQPLRSWVRDQVLGLALSGIFGVGLLEALYAGLRAEPARWWLWGIGLGSLLFFCLLWLLPVVISPLYNTFKPVANQELRERLLALAQRAGIAIEEIFSIDFSRRTAMSNAYVMGLGSTHRIVLSDTLINTFTADEIEVVTAHELGHYARRDILRRLAGTLIFIASFFWLMQLGLESSVEQFGLRGVNDIAGLPVFVLVLTLFNLLAQPLFNAYSRSMERTADRYALDLTQRPAAFISAMRKLQHQNLAEHDPPRWAVILFASHPPIPERIRLAQRYALDHGLAT